MKNAWIAGSVALAALIGAAAQQKAPGYDDTPMLPDGKWRVHDSKRPRPPLVAPGEAPGKPPSDAVILFDGTDLSKWRNGKGEAAAWKVVDGHMEAAPKAGDIWTREEFGDCQLHIEWAAPTPPKGDSQGRGNSGCFFFGQYELQVLDSHENPTYADGQAAAIYGQYPPLVNASRKPGEWQVYDVAFAAPRFKEGKVESPARFTVFHNGVLVHNGTALLGTTNHRTLPKYTAHGAKGAIKLQDHGDPVRFRNIWIRPLKAYDEP